MAKREGMKRNTNKTINWKLRLLRTGWVIVSLFLMGNFFYIQVIKAPYYKKLAEKQTIRRIVDKPERGVIYDRKHRELAVDTVGGSVFLRPGDIRDAGKVASFLTSSLGVKEGEVLRKITGEYPIVALKRNIDFETLCKVEKAMRDPSLAGIEIQRERRRFYPYGSTLSHVLGFLNVDGEPMEGVERSLNDYLGGEEGIVEGARDIKGRILPFSSKVLKQARRGMDVVLTIDLDIQQIVEEELRKAYEETKAKSATAIVMNPQNGEILALANFPTFDPNEQSKYPAENKRNRAVTDLYEMGSVVKPLVIGYALQERVITPSSRFFCPGQITINNRVIHCVVHHKGGHGEVTPAEILWESCNVGVAQVGLKLGAKRLYQAFQAFGFLEPPTDELLGARKGVIPPPQTWDKVRIANMSFGQGFSITPLHLVSAFCAIANGGILYKPHIVKEVIRPDGERIEVQAEVLGHPLSPEVAEEVKNMLVGVVEKKEGTAYGYATIEGVKVGGKTGTAQKVEGGVYHKEKVVASFVGFLPLPKPKLVILVLINEPQINRWGAVAAAPVFKQIASKALACLEHSPLITPINPNNYSLLPPGGH